MKKLCSGVLPGLLFLTISLAPSMNAQPTWNSTEEFRTEYVRLLDALAQRVPVLLGANSCANSAGQNGRVLELAQKRLPSSAGEGRRGALPGLAAHFRRRGRRDRYNANAQEPRGNRRRADPK